MASKIRRWLRELAVWLLIGAAVSLAVDYFRQPALPQNVSATSLQTLDGRTLDLNAMSQQKPLLLYVWATWCGVCRYTTPSVASLAADGGNVLTVALRSGDNATLETWLTRKKMALPTVNDPSGQLARQSGAHLRDHSNDPRTLILTLGDEGEEMQAPMDILTANLRDHALPGVTWTFTPRPSESHATIYHGAALDAFRRLYAVPAP